MVLASGSGSNAQRLMEHFAGSPVARVVLVVCNKPRAGVIERSARLGVPCELYEKKEQYASTEFIGRLKALKTDMIVLAGFLWKIPEALIKAFPGQIINLHPSLLPAYGGKGMYGENVHAAVLAAGEKQSGISIHFVNEEFDKGKIIFQASCEVEKNDNVASLSEKIHKLEHRFLPVITEQVLLKQL